MFFAHEMTHVWQWQNRGVTGYHPFRAFAEHRSTKDPYLFDSDGPHQFLDYGYEQQASLVEEYSAAARSIRAETALRGSNGSCARACRSRRGSISLDGLEILVPWDGVERRGICS